MRAVSVLRSLPVMLLGSMSLAGAQEKPAAAANPFGRVYPPRIYDTVRLQGTPPVIDGRLDDEAWKEGTWAGNYTQQIPTEGAKPSQPTEIKILYDARNVYVAIRAYDDPALVHRYAARRDTFVGDIVGVCFDSYNDKRTGFEFDLMAGGSKIDLVLGNGETEWDTSWDAVWDGKVGMEKDAWTAEFRIPLSQLRYGPHDEQVWGMHAWRWIDRNQEEDQWNLIPRKNSGRMYNLGELHGIHGLKPFRRVELLPHVVGKATSDPVVPGDPYHTGTDAFGAVGLNAKVGLTPNFTLDATVNPDFGQVEADPSVINLTAYETFYQEKRPFFLEGKSILTFSLDPDNDEGGDMLFYTRRVGHAPTYLPDLRDGESIRTPESTPILDALKITGKTKDGLSVGVVQSFTAKETAQISYQGQERQQPVEPFTGYFVGRIQKDWSKGNTSLGGMLTTARRWIPDPALEFMPTDAVTGGLDFVHYFKNRSYGFEARAVLSRVAGSTEAMRVLQTDPVHYYQRPDATYLGVDPNATSLSGNGGLVRFGRTGNSKWRFGDSLRWSSPGLDLNDLGYLRQADLIRNAASVAYEETEPHGIFRTWSLQLEREDAWDFGGMKTGAVTDLHANAMLSNKWTLFAGAHAFEAPVDTRLLRGGPAMKLSRQFLAVARVQTDASRRVSLALEAFKDVYADKPSADDELFSSLTLRLSNALSISGETAYTRATNDLQYVATPEADGAPRYVLGRIAQETLSFTFRVNFNITPDLSVQYYGSPFVSTGKYTDFKRATDTLAPQYADRFHAFSPGEIAYQPRDNAYTVSETGDGTYSFSNPDFSFRQFRSNLVARWEFTPGSSLYVVWSQGRTSDPAVYVPSLGTNFDALRQTPPSNVFLVKLSYWFSL